MRPSIVLASAYSLIALSAPVFAAEAASDMDLAAATASASADAAEEGESILVQGERPTYGVSQTSTATRTDTPIKDIPQALTVITKAQIEDQVLRSVGELLYFVPGATPGTGEGNRDQITLRGNNTSADFFRDGVRDDVQYFRDFYNVERVEVLKGPNAMIFGRGGGGGVINRVTKRSSLRPGRDFAIVGDSEGSIRLTGDVDQPLGNGVGLRVSGVYENGESFRRQVDLERYAINPTLGWTAGPNTRVDLSYEYFRDRRTADRGVPSLNGEPVEGFDRTFFGDPDKSFAKANVNIATLAVEHRFADGLTLRNRTLLGAYDKFYQNVYPNSAVLPATGIFPERVRLAAYSLRTDRTNLFSQTDLVWENRLAGIDQTLLFGFELGGQKSRNHRINGTISGVGVIDGNAVPVSDPTVDVDLVFAPIASNDDNRTRATVAAVYVQDQIRLSPMFEIVAGLRFDSFKLTVDDLRPAVNTEFSRRDQLWSPRLGLVFKPQENLSFYASYSRSYLPQSGDQFAALNPTAEALKPERFDNYEIGAKWEPIEGLLATAAIYQLDRSNTQAVDPLNPANRVLTGEQRSKGLELGLERSISDRWLISAGYAWQKAEIIETTAAAPEGREVPLVPRHSFSLWNRYDVTDKLGLGLGVIARSKSYASISNAVKLPGYARVDVAAFYDLAKGIEAQLNIENLFNADYFPTAHNDNNIAPGAPTTIKAALRFGF